MSLEKLFTPQYRKVFNKMESEGKIQTISKKGHYRIENNLAAGLKPIKEESYRKQKNSINYISQLQQRTAEV